MIKCLRARRGNVHRKQNCFRGVLLFKTHFAEFCVKSVCKTEPWNWAVMPPVLVPTNFNIRLNIPLKTTNLSGDIGVWGGITWRN